MPVTFHCPIFSFSKLDSSSYDLQQSSEYLRYLSEAVVSIRHSNTYSLMRRGAAVLLREVVLANQNLSECSISVTAGRSRRVCRLLRIEGLPRIRTTSCEMMTSVKYYVCACDWSLRSLRGFEFAVNSN